jgi:hypothetical protein
VLNPDGSIANNPVNLLASLLVSLGMLDQGIGRERQEASSSVVT